MIEQNNRVVVAAQPGCWLVLLCGGATGEPWSLFDQPLVAWDLSDVDVDDGPVPIGAGFGMPDCGSDHWAIRYPDGSYWVRGSGFGRTSSKEEVLNELVRQRGRELKVATR
jgi:hypothetical protein